MYIVKCFSFYINFLHQVFNKELLLEFDKQNITSSPQRKLDKCLLLLVQQKVGNGYYWIPPQGIRQDGESMRQVNI